MSRVPALATALFLLIAAGCFGGSGGTAGDDESTTSTTRPRVLVVTTTTTTAPTAPTATTPETTTTRPLGGPRTHRVSEGEVLGQIADQYGVSVDAIVEANGLDSPDLIYEDQELIIPPPGNNG